MNGKVLIYMQSSELAPVGGPRGYIYNLKKELDKRENTNIFFIESGREVVNKYKNKIEGLQNEKLKRVLIVIKSIIKHWNILYGFRHEALCDLSDYECVHFHSTLDMYNVRDSLKDYNGKVILSTHSPTLLSKEIYDSRSVFEKKFCGFIYNKLIKMDEYAFNRANYFIFPCPDAEEPYYNNWNEYSKIKEAKGQYYRYILTGIPQCTVKESRRDIRNKYGIPQDAFVVSYVGRHNEVKGYDLLKEIGDEILADDNTYVLVAGKEEPIKGLENKNWIEIGWTNDPHSLIAASDVFVLPNRETYFDLVMLEVLSIGQIVVASKTGGNKQFEKMDCKGIILYEDLDEAVSAIEKLKFCSEDYLKKMRNDNLVLFKGNFTCSIFADSYIQLYKSIQCEDLV